MPTAFSAAMLTLAAALLLISCAAEPPDPPYPPSDVIESVSWDAASHVALAPGSDNWPVTWAGDGHQYTAWGDGGGFGGTNSNGRVGLGVARVEGDRDGYQGFNVNGGVDPECGCASLNTASRKGKSYGIVSIDGVLYLWAGPGSNVQSYGEARLYRSTDHGLTWTPASWAFTKSDGLIMPAVLNFGQDYAGARDQYVYHYFIELQGDPSRLDVHVPGRIHLLRVPQDELFDSKEAYEFFGGLDGNGRPTWSRSISDKQPAFEDPNGVGWSLAVSYNAGIGRYLLTTEHTKSFQGNLGIFDAPEPWGPWTTAGYYRSWEGHRRTFYWNFANKWLSADGTDFTLVFTGVGDYDSWNTIRGKFRLFE